MEAKPETQTEARPLRQLDEGRSRPGAYGVAGIVGGRNVAPIQPPTALFLPTPSPGLSPRFELAPMSWLRLRRGYRRRAAAGDRRQDNPTPTDAMGFTQFPHAATARKIVQTPEAHRDLTSPTTDPYIYTDSHSSHAQASRSRGGMATPSADGRRHAVVGPMGGGRRPAERRMAGCAVVRTRSPSHGALPAPICWKRRHG